ncbi:MAG TPA: universal stress protein [Nevskiaceae bacterium]
MQTAFHDILIHVRDFKQRTPAVEFGVQMAKAFDATVTGVYVCPERLYAAASYGVAWVTDAMLESERQLVEDAIGAGATFRQWAAQQGVGHNGWLVAEASTGNALAQASMRHDLLVLDHSPEDRSGSAAEVSEVVLKTFTPCMVVPPGHGAFDGFTRIAIGWNGSPEAMRAVYAALPLLRGHDVLLMRGEERMMTYRVDWHPPLDIVKYLNRYDVHVDEKAIDAGRDDVGAALMETAAQYGADLLVMGAYGRSRFSEWILGGATRDILASASIPVLLRH